MKKKIIALYDVILYLLLCVIPMLALLGIVIYKAISSYGTDWSLQFGIKIKDITWIAKYWPLLILLVIELVVAPIAAKDTIKWFVIDADKNIARFHYPYFTKLSWKKINHNIDYDWNLQFFPTEIKTIELVKLTKDEKKKLVATKFLINKYFKITLKSSDAKYIYCGTYSKQQIEHIIQQLKK